MLSQIEEKHNSLISLYDQHRQTVYELQAFLQEEALPQLMEEVSPEGISMNDIQPWILDWIDDCGSIFRTLKKRQYDTGQAKAALQHALRWRLSELPEWLGPGASFIECLPAGTHDIWGRPILLLRLGELDDASPRSKSAIISAHEEMRRRLCFRKRDNPSLQFVMIVDVNQASMRSTAVALIPWFIKEVAPHYPGICGAAYIVNYSWAYGMYNIVKRLLPANALARLHFPTQTQLHECFKEEHLPHEYGGSLRIRVPDPPEDDEILYHPHITLSHFLPAMSALNPYFGYPVVPSPGSSVPSLKNGRRRKRDLARTLFRLWLVKLKGWADKSWLWIMVSIALWAAGSTHGFPL